MIPEEKALVKRLANEPFALIGVNSDGEAARVKPMLEKEGITWTNFIDGSTDGPISSSWNVHSWPTIYILDEKGVIRHRGLRGKPMEAAVDELLTKRKSEER